MRLTVCGTKPNPSLWAPGREALVDSRSEARLVDLSGVSAETFRAAVRYDNLYLTPSCHTKLRPEREAQDALARAYEAGCDSVVFLGTPARCLVKGGQNLTWYAATTPPSAIVAVAFCPHPSGLNRWWNDPENEAQARDFWQRVGEEL